MVTFPQGFPPWGKIFPTVRPLELDRKFNESDYDMAKFMQNNFPNIDRFLLKDVQQRYSKEYGQKLTFAQLTEKIEQTGRWKVTNVSRAYYVNRI